MYDERRFIARVEASDPDEYARILTHPTRDEESALRVHLGDERYERHRALALRAERRSRAPSRGNVVVIHGIMGGELTSFDRKADPDRVWLHVPRLLTGAVTRLWLAEDGRTPKDPRWVVRSTGMMKRTYGEQLLRLSRAWNVRAYWYDWRRDLRAAADHLAASIDDWFGADAPVHLVAHSMGGLVSRAFIQRHPDRWARMWGGGEGQGGEAGARGGRLVMLGTPNHGSFAVPQIITGLEPMVRKLALLDIRNGLGRVLDVVRTFPGSYQMLPSPMVLPEVEPLYRADAWGDRGVPQRHLSDARAFHEELRSAVDPARMIYIAGYNRLTYSGVRDLAVGDEDAYETTLEGDGRVPHTLGLLDGVDTYYVDEVHGSLPGNAEILDAMDELLETGATRQIATRMRGVRSLRSQKALQEARARERARRARDEDALELYVRHEEARGDRTAERPLLTVDERRMEQIVLRGWIGGDDPETATPAAPRLPGVDGVLVPETGSPRRVLRVDVVHGEIQGADELMDEPADALAVGHYVGVRPQFAERALDEAVSRALLGDESPSVLPESALLLTAYTERGTIRGELGQPFLLPDPRRPDRVVALAGMGLPGRFGAPELAVLARELAWSLGRLRRRHLATVLIGAGAGNLDTREATAAWLRGLQHALTGPGADGIDGLERVTFVERDAQRVLDLDRAIRRQEGWLDRAAPVELLYEPLSADRRQALEKAALEERIRRAKEAPSPDQDPEPTRLTLELQRQGRGGPVPVGEASARRAIYRFGAITRAASVPEREVPLDPTLVQEANDELPGMTDVADQFRRGQYLERLLVPRDLRVALRGDAALVMLLDPATARIHWEMVAQPDVIPPLAGDGGPEVAGCFLGTGRGLTRQLRTTFSAVPEAPPPPTRPLRVLIVADPAEDARLPGAMEEGYQLESLFRGFNEGDPQPARRIEVHTLFGPGEASRTAVLEALFGQPYDILHFAGHCVYDDEDPAASGWIFSDGRRLSAHELRRVDRIPRFVFSNACESGITPDRSEKRTAALAPSFAEAFFERGVANFVCTAWPVDDTAAFEFARELYGSLLGLSGGEPTPMHMAMRDARVAVARTARGRRSWGAYQHYGNPHFRLLPTGAAPRRTAIAAGAAGGALDEEG